MKNSNSLICASIRSIQPYVGGKPIEEVQREYRHKRVIKLASNESPYPPSKAVCDAISAAGNTIAEYPDGNGYYLKQQLARHHCLDASRITLGSGSSEILDLLVKCLCQHKRGDSILFPQHSFLVYSLLAKTYQVNTIETPLANWLPNTDALVSAIDKSTRIVFLANPSNPIGSFLANEEVYDLLQRIPEDICVVLDQAYADFVDDIEHTLSWLDEFANLVITRTFSKAYGLAGLRIGYGLASRQLTDFLNRIRPPFNVTSVALAAAQIALKDSNALQRTVANNNRGKQHLENWFHQRGIEFIPSQANFVTFRCPPKLSAEQLYAQLLKKGIIIRPLVNYGMADFLRITIGTDEQMAAFYTAFDQIFA